MIMSDHRASVRIANFEIVRLQKCLAKSVTEGMLTYMRRQTMRLIDADALKKACSEMVRGYNNSDFIPCPSWNNAMELIDNAPTVSLQDIYQEGHYDGHLEGYTKAINEERPQGEWIDYDNTFYKCPDCGYLLEKCCPKCQNKVILPKGGAEE